MFTAAAESEVVAALDIHGRLGAHALRESLINALPLRGATTWGLARVSQERSIFVGPAVDEAAAWHEQADWIGIHMCPSARYATLESDLQTWVQLDDIPFKAGKRHGMCVRWERPEGVGMLFTNLAPILPAVVPKFDNTLRCLEAMSQGGHE